MRNSKGTKHKKSSKISINPLRSDATAMYIRDKNAKHKTRKDDESIKNGYVKTRRNTLRRNERARRAGSCAIKFAAIFSMKKQKSIER